jgi:transcriptional/translational regulatory protein YebC/TACO1
VRGALDHAGLTITSAALGVVAKTTHAVPAAETERVLAFLDALDEHEDVQRVYSNVEFDDAALEALA